MNSNPIEARFSASLPAIPFGPDQTPPAEIQFMPPGEHEISARQGDKTVQPKVKVTEAAAKAIAAALQEFRSKAAEGREDRPYLDFNHEDAAAAAHVTEIYWAGEDPATGGIRAKVEWTEPGKQAIAGRAYRRFSPSFFLNANGEVSGAPLNMGGLVNRAAFKQIAPIWSRQAEPATNSGQVNQQGTTMDPKDKELADLKTALEESQRALIDIKAQLAEAKADQTVKAKDAEIIDLKSQVTALQTQIKAHATERAKGKVQAAIQAGKLAPQATAVHAKWQSLIEQDESNAALLDSMPVNAALSPVVINGNGNAAVTGAATGANTAEGFATLVKAKAAAGKTKSEALSLAIAESPDAYRAWRDANGQPGL